MEKLFKVHEKCGFGSPRGLNKERRVVEPDDLVSNENGKGADCFPLG
jgi:hypothetical protein